MLDGDGHIDEVASDALLAERPLIYRGGRIGGNASKGNGDDISDDISLAEAIRRKETYLALSRQLEYDLAAGGVCRIEDATRRLLSVLLIVRQRLLLLGRRLSTRLAHCRSPAELRAIVDAEVAQIMAELMEYDGPLGDPDDIVNGRVSPPKGAARAIEEWFLRR